DSGSSIRNANRTVWGKIHPPAVEIRIDKARTLARDVSNKFGLLILGEGKACAKNKEKTANNRDGYISRVRFHDFVYCVHSLLNGIRHGVTRKIFARQSPGTS